MIFGQALKGFPAEELDIFKIINADSLLYIGEHRDTVIAKIGRQPDEISIEETGKEFLDYTDGPAFWYDDRKNSYHAFGLGDNDGTIGKYMISKKFQLQSGKPFSQAFKDFLANNKAIYTTAKITDGYADKQYRFDIEVRVPGKAPVIIDNFFVIRMMNDKITTMYYGISE